MTKEPGKKIIGEFIEAAANNQTKAAQLLKQYPDLLNSRWIHRETIIHFLAVENYPDAVKFLGRLGFDVNAANEFGDTPLIDISTIGNVDMAKALLELGADPNATSKTRDNPLHCATESGNAELVDLLIKYGANADYVTEIEETIFDVIPKEKAKRQSILCVLKKHGIIQKIG